ncbi:5825_t:CDS:1 [Ambispora leptoticha]|uniref:5821_t:CDS:1 n=1 Tax=Ambispora leptoticha TaxID=144679 RepID=A0A9N8ZGH7_9GLOM|nr:5821_t:CDS:1 [Ambispora leptoticha]CAG8490176.1 5825_t:CDS:1 [Ambispora leptoticha]
MNHIQVEDCFDFSHFDNFSQSSHISQLVDDIFQKYPVLLKLFSFRDSFYSSIDDTSIATKLSLLTEEINKMINECSNNLLFTNGIVDQIAVVCNKQVNFVNFLLYKHNEIVETTNQVLQDYKAQRSSTNVIETQYPNISSSASNIEAYLNCAFEKSKKTRDRIDPETTLWLIKYLLDNDFEKPPKNHVTLLSYWTNVPEEDINRWYIRTNHNYLKADKKPRNGLIDRAFKYGRQLGKARITKLNNGAILNSIGADRGGRKKAKQVRQKANRI